MSALSLKKKILLSLKSIPNERVGLIFYNVLSIRCAEYIRVRRIFFSRWRLAGLNKWKKPYNACFQQAAGIIWGIKSIRLKA